MSSVFPGNVPTYDPFTTPITLQALHHTARHKQMEDDIKAMATKLLDGGPVDAAIAAAGGRIDNILNGTTGFPARITTFANAQHNHSNAANGGALQNVTINGLSQIGNYTQTSGSFAIPVESLSRLGLEKPHRFVGVASTDSNVIGAGSLGAPWIVDTVEEVAGLTQVSNLTRVDFARAGLYEVSALFRISDTSNNAATQNCVILVWVINKNTSAIIRGYGISNFPSGVTAGGCINWNGVIRIIDPSIERLSVSLEAPTYNVRSTGTSTAPGRPELASRLSVVEIR